MSGGPALHLFFKAIQAFNQAVQGRQFRNFKI